jgi:hypothetical protein
MKYKTLEERKAITAKSVETRKLNLLKKKEEEANYQEYAQKLKHGILELEKRLQYLRTQEQKEIMFGEAVKTLNAKFLLKEEDIVNNAIPLHSACGVYFLICEKRVVYVGQSKNVFNRVSEHAQGKNFDSYVYLPCEKDMLDKLESLYIHFLSPPLNGNAHNGSKVAPLKLEVLLK